MAEELRTFAYICPECRQTVIAQRSAFSLAAGDCKIPCPCGKSTLSIENMGSMYHLSVPCVACGRNHDVSCPQEALLRRKAVALTCKATGFDSCIVGEESAVFEAAKRMEESADALPENAENGKEGFLNPIVMQEVLSEVKEIAQRARHFLHLRLQTLVAGSSLCLYCAALCGLRRCAEDPCCR